MSEHVAWMLDLEIKPGCDEAVRALMPEMVAATSADEPGTLDYEWHLNEDGKQLHIFERYADSAATLAHLGNFGAKFAARFMRVADSERLRDLWRAECGGAFGTCRSCSDLHGARRRIQPVEHRPK